MRPRYRGAPPAPGSAYAVGAPSATLERAAAMERGFVMKDFRRLGLVAGVMLALLVGSAIAVNALVR